MTDRRLGEFILAVASYYDKETYAHAATVAMWVKDDLRVLLMSEEERNDVMALAWAHDLLEDTEMPADLIESYLGEKGMMDLLRLSKDDHTPYLDYIRDIVKNGSLHTLIVKQADMYDHVKIRTSTLTPRLKAKYEPAIPILLGKERYD